MATTFSASDIATLRAALLKLAAGSHTVQCMIGGKSITYGHGSIDKIKEIIVQYQVESETVPLRTYAKQGGRG